LPPSFKTSSAAVDANEWPVATIPWAPMITGLWNFIAKEPENQLSGMFGSGRTCAAKIHWRSSFI
jgi:hypothetical protein